MNKLLFLIFFFAGNLSAESQFIFNSTKEKIKIPFELSSNLIILKVQLNSVDLNLILDSGSDMNILFSYPEGDTLTFLNTRRIKIKGLGEGVDIEALVSGRNNIKINTFENNNFEVLLVTDLDISLASKLEIPIHGIIGKSFFKDYLIEINYQKRKIVIHKNLSVLNKTKVKSYSHEDITIIEDKPYLSFKAILDDKLFNLNLLMDTGLGDGLWLFENDSIKCKNLYFEDYLGRGLSGDIKGKRSRINKLMYKKFIFKEALVSFPDSTSTSKIGFIKGRNGSLGGEIIKRFNWFLDFKNQKVYFKSNSFYQNKFDYNMSGIEVQYVGKQLALEPLLRNTISEIKNNTFVFDGSESKLKYVLKPVYEILFVSKNSPAEKAGLKEKDILVSINGKKAGSYTMQKITNLLQSEDGKNITLEVNRAGVILKFKFQLKKIL